MAGVTDIRAYTALDTDFEPRFLARLDDNTVMLDNGISVATLTGSSQGCAFIPFRPSESPQSWMYCAVAEDYQKLSAPDDTNTVTAYRVGIAEPSSSPEAAPHVLALDFISDVYTDWTASGTASGLGNSNRTDTAGKCIQDPVDPTQSSRWSIGVSDDAYYQVGQPLFIGAYFDTLTIIQDVIPAISASDYNDPLEIDSIYYFNEVSSTGRCIIVPRQSPVSSTLPTLIAAQPVADTLYGQQALASLRRGALVELENQYYETETVLVLSVTRGPNGLISFECETTNTYAAGDILTGIPTIIVDHFNISTSTEGEPLITRQLDATIASGTGFIDQSPFANVYNPFAHIFDGDRNQTPQNSDYVTIGVKISDLSKFTFGRITFNVGDTVDYTTDVFYADFTLDDILKSNPALIPAAHIPSFNEFLVSQGLSTEIFKSLPEKVTGNEAPSELRRNQLQAQYDALYGNQSSPSSSDTFYSTDQWSIIQLPISGLTRLGQNQNRTLANCNGVRIQFNVTDSVDVAVTMITVSGGGQCDVGRIGSPYFYLTVKRSSSTGVRSNPSPVSRYGVSPRRQRVIIGIEPDTTDAQVDWFDIYRWGGSITSWRYVGSIPNFGSSTIFFIDDNADSSVATNPTVEYDNFEPWPTVDMPFSLGSATAEVFGTALTITFASSGDVPANLLRWLPGTLMIVEGVQAGGAQSAGVAYTFWNRPTAVTGTSNKYLFRSVESMGFGAVSNIRILEPLVACQRLPYVSGPDEAGTIFAVGDPLRPGVVYFSKSNNPDSAPDAFNLEITAPSEPLLGVEILNGLALVASSHRWWALYPQFGSPDRYQKVQRPMPRGIAGPYAHCNDGRFIYWVASDGIYRGNESGGESLTEGPLRDLFPHEGVDGRDVTYAGHTIYAPDYTRVAEFRLSYCKQYLYFDYVDSSDDRRTFVLDLVGKVPAWSVDAYADPITTHYWIEGPEQNLTTPGSTAYPKLVMGDSEGNIFIQRDRTNDNGVPIDCAISTFEFNGGDVRANQFWGDAFLDATPECGITVTPISDRTASGPSTFIPPSVDRERSVVKASGIEAKTLGILIEWTDDFDYPYDDYSTLEPTKLFAWQPLHQAVPIAVYEWRTQGTSFGLQGYLHIRQVIAAYRSTAPVTLYITAYDGSSPDPITLPSTSGVEAKVMLPVSFNKGQLYFFRGISTEPWQPYFDAWETHVGQWGRQDAYRIFTDVEAPHGIANTIV